MKKKIASVAVTLLMLITIINVGATIKFEQPALVVGDTMPNFTLTAQDGNTFNSADHVGKSFLVIYFYPKDESMVCTKEACSFRDSFDDFTRAGAKVIGINGGTVESHKSFADHYKLPFTLLSDPGDKVYHLFGVKNKMFMTGRETFIVDTHGKIVYAYEAMMQGKKHADDALAYIKAHAAK